MSEGLRRKLLSRRNATLLPVILMAALLLTACGKVKQPSGWAAPLVTSDAIYVNIKGDQLAKLSPDGGQEHWTFPNNKDIKIRGIYGEPALAGDRLIVTGYNGHVYSLNATSGAIEWNASTDGAIIGGATVVGDTVLVGSNDNYVYALNINDGSRRWRVNTGDRVWGRPVVKDGIAYVPSLNGKLYALRMEDGTPVWNKPFQAEAGLPATPALGEGVIVIGSLDKHLYTLRLDDGSVVWSHKADNWFWTTPLIQGGRVYAGNLDGHVRSWDVSNGSLRWDYTIDSPVRSSPVLRDGLLVVASKSGGLHGINADTGARAWVAATFSGDLYADLVLDKGRVYVRDKGGTLWTVDPTNGAVSQLHARG